MDEDLDFIRALRRDIEALNEKYVKLEQFHGGRYWELLRVYEERPSQQQDLKEIEMLKLTVL